MAAPKVRNLNNLVKEIGKSVAGQKTLIDADIQANQRAGDAQIAGLQAQQQQAFGQIEQGAQNKGMLFSGFTPNEQAQYTSTTYLPALANLQATIAQTRSALMGKKADLDTNVFNKAFDTREGDIGRRFQFTERVEGQKFQTSERKASQKFSADQAAQERAFKAAESQRDRSAAAANAAAANAADTAAFFDQTRRDVAKDLKDMAGKDTYVSPNTWNNLKSQWVGSGYDAKTFNSYFSNRINPSHKKDYK